MNLRLPDAIKFSRMAGPAPDGKRTIVVRTSVSESTKKLAEEKRQSRGLHDFGAYLHDLVLRDTHGVTVTKVDLAGKRNNRLNSKGGDK